MWIQNEPFRKRPRNAYNIMETMHIMLCMRGRIWQRATRHERLSGQVIGRREGMEHDHTKRGYEETIIWYAIPDCFVVSVIANQ